MVVVCLGASSAYADLTLDDGGTHDIAGPVSGHLYVYDNVAPPPTITTVNVLMSADIDVLYAKRNIIVNVHGGFINCTLFAHDHSTVNIYGGSIPIIQSDGLNLVNIYGGWTPSLDFIDGTANIYGGSISGDLQAYEGIVNVYGVGFNYPYGPITDVSGTLTGTLYMGDSLSVHFDILSSLGTINLIERAVVPAPGALVLGAIGLSCAGWRLRRRSS